MQTPSGMIDKKHSIPPTAAQEVGFPPMPVRIDFIGDVSLGLGKNICAISFAGATGNRKF